METNVVLIEQLQAEIDAALRTRALDAWQVKFLRDMQTKIQRYGAYTYLTDKQIEKLHQSA